VLDTSTIKERLKKIEEQVTLLREVQKVEKEEFIEDPHHHIYALHLLQTSIQALIDIGSHVVAGLNLGQVEEYKDIPKFLHKGKIIPKDLAKKVGKMIGLRNLIIHEYLAVDLDKVYEVIQKGLDDLEEFTRCICELIERGEQI